MREDYNKVSLAYFLSFVCSWLNQFSFISQLLLQHNLTVTFRKHYTGPYFHLHTENPFIRIISETYIDTRSKYVIYGIDNKCISFFFHFKHRNNMKENMGYHGVGSIAPVLYVIFRGWWSCFVVVFLNSDCYTCVLIFCFVFLRSYTTRKNGIFKRD